MVRMCLGKLTASSRLVCIVIEMALSHGLCLADMIVTVGWHTCRSRFHWKWQYCLVDKLSLYRYTGTTIDICGEIDFIRRKRGRGRVITICSRFRTTHAETIDIGVIFASFSYIRSFIFTRPLSEIPRHLVGYQKIMQLFEIMRKRTRNNTSFKEPRRYWNCKWCIRNGYICVYNDIEVRPAVLCISDVSVSDGRGFDRKIDDNNVMIDQE